MAEGVAVVTSRPSRGRTPRNARDRRAQQAGGWGHALKPSPETHSPGIRMDEARAGIVANAALLEGLDELEQLDNRHVGNAEIDRRALDVLTLARHFVQLLA